METSCIVNGITEEQLKSYIKACAIMWTEIARPLAEQDAYISEKDILLVDSTMEFMKTRSITQIQNSQNLQVL